MTRTIKLSSSDVGSGMLGTIRFGFGMMPMHLRNSTKTPTTKMKDSIRMEQVPKMVKYHSDCV